MKNKVEYKTKQRELIFDFLKENKHHHITAEKIVEELKKRGEPVGLATVYRSLNKLVEEGYVLKYNFAEGMSSCFQYSSEQKDCSTHYHLLCDSCGQMLHIQSCLMDEFANELKEKHNFSINKLKTVVYGICEKCIAYSHL